MRRSVAPVLLVVTLLLTSGTGVVAVGAASMGGSSIGHSLNADVGSSTLTADQVAQQSGGIIRGSPNLNVSTSDPTINPGETTTVPLQITNDGHLSLGSSETREIVTTARNVRVDVDADNTPLNIETGTVAVGSVTESTHGEAPIAVSVPSDVDEGTYTLDVEIKYSYTYQQASGVTYDRSKTISEDIKVKVDEDARFEITNVTTNAQIGDDGTLEAEIRNVGADTAHDVNVDLASSGGGLSFGDSTSDTAWVNELGPDETATVQYDIAFASSAVVREYAIDGTVRFDTSNGYQRVDESLSAGVSPLGEQGFSIGDIESDLRVGEDGAVSGTVTNDGPSEVRNVVVQYMGDSAVVIPIEESTAVGALEAGETTEFRLPMAIGGEAESGLRSFDLSVQYRDDDGESRAYDNLAVDAEIAAERDQFDIDLANQTIEPGGSRSISVDVTNNLDETVSGVEARMFANDPISTGETDTGYVESLDPGETVTMTFELSSSASATPDSTYPISFDLRYDDADGDSQLSDTFRVPIDVVETENEGLPLSSILVAVLVVVAAGGGVVWYRRQ
jgi:hypothetical protein